MPNGVLIDLSHAIAAVAKIVGIFVVRFVYILLLSTVDAATIERIGALAPAAYIVLEYIWIFICNRILIDGLKLIV